MLGTLKIERGLADDRGVSFTTREAAKRYILVDANGELAVAAPAQTDDFRRSATFLLDPQPPPASQTAVLRAGETLRADEYRRSPDGRYYLKMTADGGLVSRCGSGPGGDRPPPADPGSSAGKGVLNSFFSRVSPWDGAKTTQFTVPPVGPPFFWQGADPDAPNARVEQLADFGDAGSSFLAITDGGHVCVFQGSPERPLELLVATSVGRVNWARRRETIALRRADGRFLRYVPELLRGQGPLLADSHGFTAHETFELATLHTGRVALRSFGGYYARTDPFNARVYFDIQAPGLDHACFIREELPDGTTTLRHPTTGKLWRIDANGSVYANGEPGDPQTRLRIVPIERTMSAELGRCFSLRAEHSKKLLTVTAGSKRAGARIVQQRATGGRDQAFTLTSTTAGLYSFSAQHSGLALAVLRADPAAGAALVQEPLAGPGGAPAQTFRLLPNDDGTYCVVAAHSGLCLEVAAASQEDGAVVVQAALTGALAQRFRVEPGPSLPTRVLVAAPTWARPMVVHYQERLRQSTWLDGFLDIDGLRFVGDFARRGQAQLLCARRTAAGGVALRLADLGGGGSPARLVFPQISAGQEWLPGWFDEVDWQRTGNFLGAAPAYQQLLLLDRGGHGGRLCVMDLSSGAPTTRLLATWGAGSPLDGWHDDGDLWLVGDFMNQRVDDVLCIRRTPDGGGKLMLLRCAGDVPQVRARVAWSEHTWLDPWVGGDVRHFSGDFLGRGWPVWLMIDARTCDVLVVDLTGGAPVEVLAFCTPWLRGFLDRDDGIVVGDFLARGRAQLLCTNTDPRSGDPKLMIVELIDGEFVARQRDEWSARTCLDGLLERGDSMYAADLVKAGGGQVQLLVTNPSSPREAPTAPTFGLGAAPPPIPLPADTGNRWQHIGEAHAVKAIAWHEGSLYIVSNDHLYRRMSFAEGSGNAWAECGEAWGVVAMTSHQGALYIVSNNHLYRRGALGPGSGNDWTEAGEAWGVSAMASHQGALYIVSNNHLYRRGALGPGTGNAWTEAGEAFGVLGMTAHAGKLYIVSNGRLYRRGQLGPGTGNDWIMAGTSDPVLGVASSGQTIYGLSPTDFTFTSFQLVALVGAGPVPRTDRNAWQRVGDAWGVVAMAWHEGSLYIVSNNHLYRRTSLAEGSGNAWVEAGEAWGVVAMASHQGALHIVSNNHLYRRGALGPGTGNAWTEAGEAWGVTAMTSHQGALYIVSGNHLHRRGALGPGTGNDWTEAGEAWGVPSMTSHQGELYIVSPQNKCLYRRGALGPLTGNDWSDAGGAADLRHVASSERTLFACNIADNGLYRLTQAGPGQPLTGLGGFINV